MAKYAVCVGINNYPGTANDLSGCVNDANDWEGLLKKRGFATTKLLDKAATKKAISAALTNATTKAKSGDLVVFTYSGHGSWQPDDDGDEPDGRDEGWCPYDIGTVGLLTDDEMYEIFSEAKTGVKLMMLSDSCHSGSVAKMAPPHPGAVHISRVRFMPPERFLPKSKLKVAEQIAGVKSGISKPHRALLISGCKDTEYSYDANFDNRPNGAFSYFALKALSKLTAKATYVDWHKAIRKELPSQSHPQTPILFGSASQKKWSVLS
jgi:hypothetical protein